LPLRGAILTLARRAPRGLSVPPAQELPKKLPGKAKAKNAYAPEDVAEVKQLVLEGQDPDTRRNALLGLFKLSLRDGLEELLIEEGASVVCQLASTAEAKGSGARRAAVQVGGLPLARPPSTAVAEGTWGLKLCPASVARGCRRCGTWRRTRATAKRW
jgi:hypothetical protein